MGILFIQGDSRHIPLADKSIHVTITSVPYFNLRDYEIEGQIGVERSPEEYVENILEVFREVWRVMRDDGTLWLNIADTYAGSGGAGGDYNEGGRRSGQPRWRSKFLVSKSKREPGARWGGGNWPASGSIKPKDMIGIPWLVALALRNDGADTGALRVIQRVYAEILDSYAGDPIPDKILCVLERLQNEYSEAKGRSWWLRQDIIWQKPNAMTESVKDRCTKSHEYLFLLSKSRYYYFDWRGIQEPANSQELEYRNRIRKNKSYTMKEVYDDGNYPTTYTETQKRNRRSVWSISTEKYGGAHYAVYPKRLVEPCIMAGSSDHGCCSICGAPWERFINGESESWRPRCECGTQNIIPATVFDPFNGSGVTGVVAAAMNRNYIGVELKQEYINQSIERMAKGVQVRIL